MQPLKHSMTTQTPQPTERLERARQRVSFALAEIASDSAPGWETLDDVARALTAALRDLEALQFTVAVMQRRERRVH